MASCPISPVFINMKESREKRSREHIEAILRPNESKQSSSAHKAILDDLSKVYRSSVQPLEELYKYSHLKCQTNAVAEIYAKPSLLFLGPWSSGKTSMINYLLGLEGRHALRTGIEPTTTDFVIIDNGPKHQVLPGTTLLADASKPYKPLEHYGMNLAAGVQAVESPSQLLKRLTIIDTPGILECNDPRKRGYPFNSVCQWFIGRASLIFLVFDPSKLDAGKQMQELFQKLKGHESKVRIILNKADAMDNDALTRAYGAFFWSLRSLLPNLVEPPKVYLVSFWNQPLQDNGRKNIFLADETSLLQDIQKKIENHLQESTASLLRHAMSVTSHAVIVDTYLGVYYYYHYRWLRWRNSELQCDIVSYPDQFDIPQKLLASSKSYISGGLDVLAYKRFFRANPLDTFRPASQYRDGLVFAGQTNLEKIQRAIEKDVPQLLAKYRKLTSANEERNNATNDKYTLWSLKCLLDLPQKQLNSLMSKNPLDFVLYNTPLGFVAQKVQSNIDYYKRG